jgi:hypothetical protein
VLQLQRSEALPAGFAASECRTEEGVSRVYFGCDGVMVPLITDAEKRLRRQKIKQKRGRRGRRARPLPTARKGADQKYKEFKILAFYDQSQEHRLDSGTRGDHEVAGRWMRHQAARIGLARADEKVGNVDGAPWIRRQVARRNLCQESIQTER